MLGLRKGRNRCLCRQPRVVIEAADKIGKRTQVTLRDALTGREFGKLEEWPDIDCLRIRIIGLHAGPVAVTTPA